ncbi:MAG: ribonucleotide-diphosphate reductase subunit alpha [Candidatus Melainabacteria bacterium GWF2_37_15]|nr:MAG: ribonucleotide-diphosphate reductase subunit alpha [Candidatus Melainabacteria bacterium GWF2_37_15]
MTSNTSKTLETVKLSENAHTVLSKRYLKRDKEGNPIETPETMFWRVAETIAQADKNFGKNDAEVDKTTEEFYEIMAKLCFMPNSPTLMNAGRELGQLSACFVLPVEDSLEQIFETIKNTAMIHKSGGGTGFSFSRLRPKNDIVKSTMGVSSGPVSFIEVFNAATEAVKQGGTRRGANMAILRVDHPDILDFINAKFEGNKLTNFNLSVGITDKFMEAVKSNEEYDLIHPNSKKSIKKLKAREVFNLIVDHAWRNGEPGIVFLDKVNKYNPTPKLGEIESTNPCGEVPLLPYEACNLGSINLAKMVKYVDNKPEVDWEKLEKVTRLATHFLDNVIEANHYPLPKIRDMVNGNRKVGLGLMGWADLLMILNVPYNSEEGTNLANQVIEVIDYNSKLESLELSKQRGKFPNFEGSVYENGNFLYEKYRGKSGGKISDDAWKYLDEQIKEYGIRNATTTCIAPTGTISMIAGSSCGIEPLFALVFSRHIMDGATLFEVNPIFEYVAKEREFYSQELLAKISQNSGTVHGINEVPEDIRRVFVTAHEISPEWHVKMQAAFQLHTDNAVSKTVNFEEDATREDIAKTYLLAYESDLKGITVYRNNSRFNQAMQLKSDKKDEKKTDENETKCHSESDKKVLTPRERPSLTKGITDKSLTGCGPIYVTINSDEAGLCEVFARIGKSGGCATSQAEATGRMISLALRAGVDVESIIEQLKGIRCPAPSFGKGGVILSCSDAIAKVLERNLGTNSEENGTCKLDTGLCPECPECGAMLEFKEGCAMCSSCGFSRCS